MQRWCSGGGAEVQVQRWCRGVGAEQEVQRWFSDGAKVVCRGGLQRWFAEVLI